MRKWGKKIVIFALAVYLSSMNVFGKKHLQEKRYMKSEHDETDVYSTSYRVRYKVCCCVGQMTI